MNPPITLFSPKQDQSILDMMPDWEMRLAEGALESDPLLLLPMIQNGIIRDVNARDSRGITLLGLVCRRVGNRTGAVSDVKVPEWSDLNNPETRDDAWRMVFARNDVDDVWEQHRADIEKLRNEGKPFRNSGTVNGDVRRIAVALLGAGADPFAAWATSDGFKESAFSMAVLKNHLAFVKRCLEMPNAPLDSLQHNILSISKLHTVDSGSGDYRYELLKAVAKAKTEAREMSDSDAVRKSPVSKEARTGLLHFAVAHNMAPMVAMLLKHGWDPNEKDDTGSTPLHFLGFGAYTRAEGKEEDIATLLLEAGANPEMVDILGNTPISTLQKRTEVLGKKEQDALMALMAKWSRRTSPVDTLSDEEHVGTPDKPGYASGIVSEAFSMIRTAPKGRFMRLCSAGHIDWKAEEDRGVDGKWSLFGALLERNNKIPLFVDGLKKHNGIDLYHPITGGVCDGHWACAKGSAQFLHEALPDISKTFFSSERAGPFIREMPRAELFFASNHAPLLGSRWSTLSARGEITRWLIDGADLTGEGQVFALVGDHNEEEGWTVITPEGAIDGSAKDRWESSQTYRMGPRAEPGWRGTMPSLSVRGQSNTNEWILAFTRGGGHAANVGRHMFGQLPDHFAQAILRRTTTFHKPDMSEERAAFGDTLRDYYVGLTRYYVKRNLEILAKQDREDQKNVVGWNMNRLLTNLSNGRDGACYSRLIKIRRAAERYPDEACWTQTLAYMSVAAMVDISYLDYLVDPHIALKRAMDVIEKQSGLLDREHWEDLRQAITLMDTVPGDPRWRRGDFGATYERMRSLAERGLLLARQSDVQCDYSSKDGGSSENVGVETGGQSGDQADQRRTSGVDNADDNGTGDSGADKVDATTPGGAEASEAPECSGGQAKPTPSRRRPRM